MHYPDHTEFLSITFLLQRESFTDYDWSAIPETIREWRSEAFNDIATHIRIEQRNSEQDLTYNLAQTFNGQFQKEFLIHDIYRDLLASQVSDGAFVWTPSVHSKTISIEYWCAMLGFPALDWGDLLNVFGNRYLCIHGASRVGQCSKPVESSGNIRTI